MGSYVLKTIKPVSTLIVFSPSFIFTVFECPPNLFSHSKSSTLNFSDNFQAQESPEIPLPTTAIFFFFSLIDCKDLL